MSAVFAIILMFFVEHDCICAYIGTQLISVTPHFLVIPYFLTAPVSDVGPLKCLRHANGIHPLAESKFDRLSEREYNRTYLLTHGAEPF
jgi:hypothetical protein